MSFALTCLINAQNASRTSPRTVDFSGVQLNPTTAAILSDVFTIEWGLRRLTFKECGLDDRVRARVLRRMTLLLIGYTDIETNPPCAPHSGVPHILICYFESTFKSASVPFNWRLHSQGVQRVEQLGPILY